MGLFKRKADPISDRARELNREISELEEKIRRLNDDASTAKPAPAPLPPADVAPGWGKMRSTARPMGPTPHSAAGSAAADPMRGQAPRWEPPPTTTAPKEPGVYNEFGVRKFDLPGLWKQVKEQFTGKPSANPKLISLLAAGQIQGMRPLKIEKRVARNRFIAVTIIFILALWGIIAMAVKR